MTVGLKSIIASFTGTQEDWRELREYLHLSDPRDRRLAETILKGIERQKLKYIHYVHGYMSMNQRQEMKDRVDKDQSREYTLRLRGGSIHRVQEIIDSLENEAYYRAEGEEILESDGSSATNPEDYDPFKPFS